MGGDEFLVISQSGWENARESCIALAERIIETVRQPIAVAQGAAHVGTSIGIALYPDREHSIEHSIQMADSAMSQAKNAGKGCYALEMSITPPLTPVVNSPT
jgi:diguanylate cyclase (GGDEF)-like protein